MSDPQAFPILIVAQDNGPPTLGGSGGGGTDAGTTGAPGGGPGAPAGASPFGGGMMTIFFVVILLLLFWSFSSQRKEKKKRESLIASIRKHDQVQTIGGIIGSVIEVKSNTVVLKVDESSNTRMTFAKSAIQQVLKENPEPQAKESAE